MKVKAVLGKELTEAAPGLMVPVTVTEFVHQGLLEPIPTPAELEGSSVMLTLEECDIVPPLCKLLDGRVD